MKPHPDRKKCHELCEEGGGGGGIWGVQPQARGCTQLRKTSAELLCSAAAWVRGPNGFHLLVEEAAQAMGVQSQQGSHDGLHVGGTCVTLRRPPQA